MRKKELTLSTEPIKFSDPEVKRRCIKAGWDLDGDGEISYFEAAKVKSIGRVFSENYGSMEHRTRIKYFGEFQFFTGVTCLDPLSFEWCEELECLILPETLQRICKCAFKGCGKLSEISIPNSVIEIEASAFYKCNGLYSILGRYSYKDNKSLIYDNRLFAIAPKGLSEYEVPECVKIIDIGVFDGITSLEKIILPHTISHVEAAFNGCCGTLYLDCNIRDGEYNAAFLGNRFERIVVGPNVEYLSSLSEAKQLKRIEFTNPSRLSRISKISHTQIEELLIPSGVTEFSISFNKLLRRVTIPRSATTLKSYALAHCLNLDEVKLHDNIQHIGRGCFEDCIQLSNIILSPKILSVEEDTFAGCTNLTDISFPEGIQKISRNAFKGCTQLKQIIVPHSVNRIERGAFADCSGLESVILPEKHINIEKDAFIGCVSIDKVQCDLKLLVGYISWGVFDKCPMTIRMRCLLNKSLEIQTEYEDYSRDDLEDMYRDAMGGDASNEWNID